MLWTVKVWISRARLGKAGRERRGSDGHGVVLRDMTRQDGTGEARIGNERFGVAMQVRRGTSRIGDERHGISMQ